MCEFWHLSVRSQSMAGIEAGALSASARSGQSGFEIPVRTLTDDSARPTPQC